MKLREKFIWSSIAIILIVVAIAQLWQPIVWSFILILPIVLLGFYDISQKKHAILRNFPIVGHGRYLLEKVRPEIMQYFVETDTQGRPINRMFRTLIYQRAKNVNDTTPFGTKMDVYKAGYEWMDH